MELKEFTKEEVRLEKPVETTKALATTPQELVLPTVEAPTFVYKKDTKMFWLGIPADKCDAFTANCIIDSMKLQYLNISKTLMAEAAQKKDKILPPSALNRLRENFVRKFKK